MRNAHLGWQRWPDDKQGRWLLRQRLDGRYSQQEIGTADDLLPADGLSVLSFEQARAKGVDLASGGKEPAGRLTVAKAMADYLDFQAARGKDRRDPEYAIVAHILPALGTKTSVDDLTSSQLRRFSEGAG